MLRRKLKGAVAVLLAACICASMTITGSITASANFVTEFMLEKLVDVGMRTASKSLDKIGEATGDEGGEQIASFVNHILLMDASEVAIEEVKELCEDILEELDLIDEKMTESLAQIESVLAQSQIKALKSAVDDQWNNDVDMPIRDANALNAMKAYRTYLEDALNGCSNDVIGKDYDRLISAYSNMYEGTIPVSQNNTEDLGTLLFEDGRMNKNIENLILELAENLDYGSDDNETSVALRAAQFAYMSYPFSHQQYQYVQSIMYKQIMQIVMAEMMYNEYLFQQGEYFSEKYGVSSKEYEGYLNYQSSFFDLMQTNKGCVNEKIEAMLTKKMNVDGTGALYLSLNDYMRPEDAVTVTLSINDYINEFDALHAYLVYLGDEDYLDSGDTRDGTYLSKATYIGNTVRCRRVMTHTLDGSKIFYILDPEQYAGTDALYISSIDHKIDVKSGSDFHTESCDYRNLCSTMSDGSNTFQTATDKDFTGFQELFNTNYFALLDSRPQSYLSVGGYLPSESTNPGTTQNFLITDQYRYESSLGTRYSHFWFANCDSQFTGKNVNADTEVYMGDYHESKEQTYTVALRNIGSTYQKKLFAELSSKEGGSAELKIQPEDSQYVISPGENLTVESGKTLNIRMKPVKGRINSLSVRREDGESELLLDGEQISGLPLSADGYYEFSCTMPYSDTTFILEAEGGYQTASIEIYGNSGGTASLDSSTAVTDKVCKTGETQYVYVDPDDGYAVHTISLKDPKTGNMLSQPITIDPEKTAASEYDVYSFDMPSQDVIIMLYFKKGYTASFETRSFVYDKSGNRTSYLYFTDDPSADSRCYAPGFRAYFKAVAGDGYSLSSISAKGVTSGNEYTVSQKDGTYYTDLSDEDIVITPSFVRVDPDGNEVHGIRTYEELCDFARSIQSDYGNTKNADVWLDNNIIAPADSEWTLGIGTKDKPFCGSFDGKGYAVVGLNVSVEDNGGMFGVIGEEGLVKDLAVIDCDFKTKSVNGGGIAGMNYGTIDHCTSGINMDSSIVYTTKNGKKLDLVEYNSYVSAQFAGGIAGVNYGTIIGTRNGAYVVGDNGGGIASVNYGLIYGSANNGPVGKNSVTVENSGGIVYLNNGRIESSYNSGLPNGDGKTFTGMIAAENDSADVKNVFYSELNGIPPVGTNSGEIPDSTNILKKNTEMLDPSFADTMNSVTDTDRVLWKQVIIRNTYLNGMYPVIQGNFLKNRYLTAGYGVAVSGMMHSSLSVSYEPVAQDDELYSELSAAADGSELSAAYRVSFDDGSGNFIPAELWCSGVTVSVPVQSDSAEIIITTTDGSAERIAPDEIRDGKAYFTVAEPVTFAVLDNTTSSGANDTGNTDDAAVATGDNTPAAAFAAIAIVSAGAAIILSRRRKNRE